MTRFQESVYALAEATGTCFRPASREDIVQLRSLELPNVVIDFYASHEPEFCAEGQVRLWAIDHLLQENRDLLPGAYVAPLGYIVFATTYFGDAYCFNLNSVDDRGEPQIVLISHEVIHEDITREEVVRLAKPVASDLEEFLQMMVRGEVDEDCVY